ncbi:MAG: hypothetical protein J7452_10390 [Thermoflexus sp.]|nr:hypothetical protein [Thermoflexus sp.]
MRIAARTMEDPETSRRRIQEADQVFARGRPILRRLPGGFLALCCACSMKLPLLNLALGPVVHRLTAALKEGSERPAAPRRLRPAAPRVSSVIRDLVQEGRRLVEAARAQGLTLRLLRSVGVADHCPSALQRLLVPALVGLELAGSSRERRAVEAFLEDQGYEPFARFNAFYGAQRLHFRKPETGWPVDIFLDAYEMYHHLEFASVLTREEIALPPAYLLLSRLQVVEAGEADLLEISVLLLHHEVVEGGRQRRWICERSSRSARTTGAGIAP